MNLDASPPTPAARRRHLGAARGFTLIELMVAVSGGLVISIAVFLLARQASRFYTREGRTSTAVLSSVVGFERLRADIGRAGYMASPNIRANDPAPCNKAEVIGSGAGYLRHLQSVMIRPLGIADGLPSVFTQTGFSGRQQAITLAGNFASTDQYTVRDIAQVGTTHVVTLAVETPTVQTLVTVVNGVPIVPQDTLLNLFHINSAVRIVDTHAGPTNSQWYGRVTGAIGGAQPAIILSSTSPQLPDLDTGTTTTHRACGLSGIDVLFAINPVNIIEYSLKALGGNATYAPLYNTTALPSDSTRVDLVRQELDVAGTPVAGTLELITEYAVALTFAPTALNNGRLEAVGLAGWADDTSIYTDPIIGPQRIRTLRTSLSVRSREADRTVAQVGTGGLLRFGVGPSGGAPYARVRTVTADVSLNNQLGVTW
jgi:hypothetical protein